MPPENPDQPLVRGESSQSGIRLRVLASVVALVAGIAAVVIVIELVRVTLA
jgi:hypothetical protein